jgi:hypothetical protein
MMMMMMIIIIIVIILKLRPLPPPVLIGYESGSTTSGVDTIVTKGEVLPLLGIEPLMSSL